MELLKFFFKDEVPAVGLTIFKEKNLYRNLEPVKLDFRRQIFKPNYSNNFFLL